MIVMDMTGCLIQQFVGNKTEVCAEVVPIIIKMFGVLSKTGAVAKRRKIGRNSPC